MLSVSSEMPVGDCPVRSNGGSGSQLGPDDKTARLSIVGTVGGGEAGRCNLRAMLDFKLCYFFFFLINSAFFFEQSIFEQKLHYSNLDTLVLLSFC